VKITDLGGTALAEHEVTAVLGEQGAVLFSAADRDIVTDFLRTFAEFHRHPHAEPHAWTLIHPATDPGTRENGRGFSRSALVPHTDRSSLDVPPSLLCFLMLDATGTGGEALLADTAPAVGRVGADSLRATQGELWLRESRGTGRQQVFSVNGDLCVMRYRADDIAAPVAESTAGAELLAELRRSAAAARTLSLRPGDGYLIHNHRVLHGRTAFTGERRCARLLGHVRAGSPYAWLNGGYRIGEQRVPEGEMS
jgi:alpha-ketoglutarate-dependent taurine dioxygenase